MVAGSAAAGLLAPLQTLLAPTQTDRCRALPLSLLHPLLACGLLLPLARSLRRTGSAAHGCLSVRLRVHNQLVRLCRGVEKYCSSASAYSRREASSTRAASPNIGPVLSSNLKPIRSRILVTT